MMRKKILTLAIFVGAMLLLTATGVLAASPTASNSHPTLQDPLPAPTIRATVTVTNPVAAMIALFFGLDPAQVQEWHDKGIGYGNMAIALFLGQAHCEASGDDDCAMESMFDAIMTLRDQDGGGWGRIIKDLGLVVSRRDTNLGAIRSGRVTETVTVTVTLQGTAKPDKGPKETPPGWEQGKGSRGQGHDKGDQGQGHGKGQQGQPQGKGRGPKQ